MQPAIIHWRIAGYSCFNLSLRLGSGCGGLCTNGTMLNLRRAASSTVDRLGMWLPMSVSLNWGWCGREHLRSARSREKHQADCVCDRLISMGVEGRQQPVQLIMGEMARSHLLRVTLDLSSWVLLQELPP